jgi:hypothetical protein
MYRDTAFQDPFETMQLQELVALGRLFGRRCLQAKWAFLALLPEIDRRQAYKGEGSTSITEYGARGGASRREVMGVLHLYRRIGQHWVLWRLLAMGAVGLSKMQRVAAWVSVENASWWAEQLVKCTRKQLDALIARLKESAVAGRQAGPARPEAEVATTDSVPECLASPALSSAAGQAGASQMPNVSSMVAESLMTTANLMTSVSAEPAANAMTSASTLTPALPTGRTASLSWPGERLSESEFGARVGVSESGPRFGGEADNLDGAGAITVKVSLSRHGAKALRDLHDLVVQAEGPVSLGNLIERLVVRALERGEVPAAEQQGEGLVAQPAANGAASTELPQPAAKEAASTELPQSAAKEAASTELLQPAAKDAATTVLPQRRLLHVAYRNLDTGAGWIPSAEGPLPVEGAPPAERKKIESTPPVYFAELRARALAAQIRHARKISAKVRAGQSLTSDDGRHIPVAIAEYLMARSGGLCEIRGCKWRVEHLHHCDPYSDHHRHDPDRMLAICTHCHDGIHGELVAHGGTDPRVLVPVKPGAPFERSRVGKAVLAAKAKA